MGRHSLYPFESSWYRFDRAATHRQAAISKWSAFLEKDPYDSHLSLDDNGKWSLWFSQDFRVPPSIGVLFGEYFYNLRTALDYCIYDVAIRDSKKNPPPKVASLQFPIYSDPATWESNYYRIKPLSEKHRDWLKSIQPGFREDGEPKGDALYWLNRLAYRDRHRQLHVVGAYVTESAPLVWVRGEQREVIFDDLEPHIFVEGDTEIARFAIVPSPPEHDVEANPNTALAIEIEEMARERTPDLKWLYFPLRARLLIIEAYVDAVIGRFEQSCMGWTRSKYVTEAGDIDGPAS